MNAVFSVCMLLLLPMTAGLSIPRASGSGSRTIYIRPDGSVDPPTAPIQRRGIKTRYIFTDNIYETIVIGRDHIVVDGHGYTLQGPGGFPRPNPRGVDGIFLSGRTGVTIKNVIIKAFDRGGIHLLNSHECVIRNNKISPDNGVGIWLKRSSSNTIIKNNIKSNAWGIELKLSSSSNVIEDNNIEDNLNGIIVTGSRNNIIRDNNIEDNEDGLSISFSSDHNRIYHNNFTYNGIHAHCIDRDIENIWDNGYPSGGNYWMTYTGVDVMRGKKQNRLGSDGIGDKPYVVNAHNKDRYPLMSPYKKARA